MKFKRPLKQHHPDALQCWKRNGCQSCLMAHRERARVVLETVGNKEGFDALTFLENWGLDQVGLGDSYHAAKPEPVGLDNSTADIAGMMSREIGKRRQL